MAEKRKTILICESDLEILRVCKTILRKEGYRIKRCGKTKNIIETVVKIKPDCILLDSHFQNGNLKETVSLLRKSDFKSVPIILFSTSNNIKHAAQQYNADGFIKKPFDLRSFEETIKKHAKPDS